MGNSQATETAAPNQSSAPSVLSKKWTMADITKYAKEKGSGALIVIIHQKVFDLTRFKYEHPGGQEVLEKFHCKDATEEFDDAGHSPDAIEMMDKYLLGSFQEG